MDISKYDAFMTQVSHELAAKFLAQEDRIAERARFIDADIAELPQQIGLETTKCIYEQVLTRHVSQKKTKDSPSNETRSLNLT